MHFSVLRIELMTEIICDLSTYLLLRARWNPALPKLIYVPILLFIWCKDSTFILKYQKRGKKKKYDTLQKAGRKAEALAIYNNDKAYKPIKSIHFKRLGLAAIASPKLLRL